MKFRAFLTISLCVMLCGCSRSYSDEIMLEEADSVSISDDDAEDGYQAGICDTIYVYACGEVVSPGVYEVKPDSRIFEILALAGGTTAEADLSGINQAESCYDGEKIYVPAAGEYAEVPEDENEASGRDGRININTADSPELQQLKGIGASRA